MTDLAAPFRHRRVGGHEVVTSLDGSWTILTPPELGQLVDGTVEKGGPLWQRLDSANLLQPTFNQARAAERMRRRRSFVHAGPNLHLVIVTLRCNETCVYCHASRADMDAVHTDMTPELAERTVDFILKSTSPNLTIEFQGGEPLVNFPVVQRVIEYALERNKTAGKQLEFTMVSNLALMDEAKLEYLLAHKVQICTSIDGPRVLHDRQRKLPGLSAYDASVRWIERINQAYIAAGLDPTLYHVEALLTTTRETLPMWREVVDAYVALGCRALFLRPVDPFGFMDKTSGHVEYPRSEYLAFYRRAVDYMIELNGKGVQILERFAAIFLTKILAGEDPNFLDIRTPGGAGIGQLAYNYDGLIFSSDEGRMLHETGDDAFLLGDVRTAGYRDVVGHPTVRALALASNLDQQPDCVDCAYNPYCGTKPEQNYKSQGSIFGRMRESTLCAVHKGIQDYLFEKLGGNDPTVRETFERWTTNRPRNHFLQDMTTPPVAR